MVWKPVEERTPRSLGGVLALGLLVRGKQVYSGLREVLGLSGGIAGLEVSGLR